MFLNASWQVATGLHLAAQSIQTSYAAPALPPSVHRFFVADCSGSMWGELDKVRTHTKNTVATTVRDGDTVTIIWFSGRGQFGTVVKAAKVHNALDLQALCTAIDRYLQPVGLTGFKEPLEETLRIIDELKAKDASAVFSLLFMSDGYDNQWSQKEILAVSDAIGPRLGAAAVVEYGWYANRPLLTKMAESLGGVSIFCEDFAKFATVLDDQFRQQVDGVKKREVALAVEPKNGFAFAVRAGAVAVYGTGGEQKVRIPEDVDTLYYFADAPVGQDLGPLEPQVAAVATGESATPGLVPVLYGALTVLSQRMLSDEVFKVLKVLGDVTLIKQFANCFGKQAYSAFQEAAAAASADAALRWAEGYDPSLVPAEDAYTVLDLLSDLMEEEGNLLHIAHPAFQYQRIGRKTENAVGNLTEEEKAEIAELTAKAKNAADLEAVAKRLAEISAAKPKPVTFKNTDREKGIPLSSLTLNETRPNVSVLTRQEGLVEIGENALGLPAELPSFIFRNYAVIRDGILNLKVMPVSLTRGAYDRLAAEGLVAGGWDADKVYEVRLEGLPIVNRKMVKKVSATECFSLQFELAKARAAQKVFKAYEEQHFPKERAAGLKEKFGEQAAEWLKSVGVTDGGFAPKVTKAEASDVYIARELKIALKGLSSLPKVSDVETKLASGQKLTTGDAVMAPFVKEYQEFIASGIYTNAVDPAALLKVWLGDKTKFWVKRARELNRQLSEIKFSVVVGQVWFSEFDSIDEGTLTLTIDGVEVTATATLREFEEEI